jgi:hypothetical protein
MAKRGPKLGEITSLIEGKKWDELNTFFGSDIRGVLFEMQEFARLQTPLREDVVRRVAYALLVLRGMSGAAGYRSGNGRKAK